VGFDCGLTLHDSAADTDAGYFTHDDDDDDGDDAAGGVDDVLNNCSMRSKSN